MISKLTFVGFDAEEKLEKQFGRFNDMPPNARVIQEEEFYSAFFTEALPTHIIYKRVTNHPTYDLLELHIFSYDRTWIAVGRGQNVGVATTAREYFMYSLNPTLIKTKPPLSVIK